MLSTRTKDRPKPNPPRGRRVRRLILILALAAPLACGHARHVAQAEDRKPVINQPPDQGTAPRAERAPVAPRSTPRGEARKDEKNVDDAKNAEDRPPPLATSPAGLLEPGAVKRIQERLHERGFLTGDARSGKLDGRTREALRELQKKHKLPATGTPDDLTMQKLGLDAGELARSAQSDD